MGRMLYLIEILHQTTTVDELAVGLPQLYLIEILHQTTTLSVILNGVSRLYLIEILHQTTTCVLARKQPNGCILLKFYIKPQQCEQP